MTTVQWKKMLASAALLAMTLTATGAAMAATPEEKQEIKVMHEKAQKIMKEHRSATDATRKQLLLKKAELEGQMESSMPDTAKIESLAKEIGALKGILLVDQVKLDQELEKAGLPPHMGMPGMGRDCGDHGPHDKAKKPKKKDHM